MTVEVRLGIVTRCVWVVARQMGGDALLDAAELAPDTADGPFDGSHSAAPQRASLMERALAKFLHFTDRFARELLSLLYDQFDGLDDATQDLLDGDRDRDGVAKRDSQRRSCEVRRAVWREFTTIEEDARRLGRHGDDQEDQHERDKYPAKRFLERTQDMLANIAEDMHESLFHTLLLSPPGQSPSRYE